VRDSRDPTAPLPSAARPRRRRRPDRRWRRHGCMRHTPRTPVHGLTTATART